MSARGPVLVQQNLPAFINCSVDRFVPFAHMLSYHFKAFEEKKVNRQTCPHPIVQSFCNRSRVILLA